MIVWVLTQSPIFGRNQHGWTRPRHRLIHQHTHPYLDLTVFMYVPRARINRKPKMMVSTMMEITTVSGRTNWSTKLMLSA
jgi:hypothetical protein